MNINTLPNDPANSLQNWYNKIGFGTKFVMATPLILFLIEYMFGVNVTYYLIDVPYFVIHEYEIYRLFFAQFIQGSFPNVLINGVMFSFWVNYEEKVGTAVFVVDFFIKSFLVQVIYVFITIIFQITTMPSLGLWNVILVYVTLDSIANPDRETSLFFLPCTFKAKFMPLMLFAMGFLFSQRIAIDQIAAVILGLIEAKYFNFMLFRPSQNFIKKMENNPPFSIFKKKSDFMLNRTNFHMGSSQVNDVALPVENQTTAWQGRGVAIGATDPEINYGNQNYGIQGQ